MDGNIRDALGEQNQAPEDFGSCDVARLAGWFGSWGVHSLRQAKPRLAAQPDGLDWLNIGAFIYWLLRRVYDVPSFSRMNLNSFDHLSKVRYHCTVRDLGY